MQVSAHLPRMASQEGRQIFDFLLLVRVRNVRGELPNLTTHEELVGRNKIAKQDCEDIQRGARRVIPLAEPKTRDASLQALATGAMGRLMAAALTILHQPTVQGFGSCHKHGVQEGSMAWAVIRRTNQWFWLCATYKFHRLRPFFICSTNRIARGCFDQFQ